jgi:hypothetical protein
MDTLEDLEYADDLCVLVHRFSDMHEKISKLEKESEIFGLRINIAKAKELRVNPKTQKQRLGIRVLNQLTLLLILAT